MHLYLGTVDQERDDGAGLVRRQVVGDHAISLAARVVGHDVGKEGHKLGRSVPFCGLAKHFAGVRRWC